MQMVIDPCGGVRCLYGEEIDLHLLGKLSIQRASHVEPNEGVWQADLSPAGGPFLGPFKRRTDALQAEIDWLETHWLDRPPVNGETIT